LLLSQLFLDLPNSQLCCLSRATLSRELLKSRRTGALSQSQPLSRLLCVTMGGFEHGSLTS
jgi:hypothetical protein